MAAAAARTASIRVLRIAALPVITPCPRLQSILRHSGATSCACYSLLERVKPRRILRQDTLRQFRRIYRSHKAVNQDIVPKIAIRCDDSAALLLFLWRRMWPIAAPKAAFRRRGENCAKPNGIRFCPQRVRAHAVWRRKLAPDVRQAW